MEAATRLLQGRTRRAILLVTLVFAEVLGLSAYKNHELDRFASALSPRLDPVHSEVLGNFQANFFFFYEDRFLPGLQEAMNRLPELERVRFFSNPGVWIFDSAKPETQATPGKVRPVRDSALLKVVESPRVTLFRHGFRVDIAVPAGNYTALYSFLDSPLRTRVLALLVGGLFVLFLLFFGAPDVLRKSRGWSGWSRVRRWLAPLTGLRTQFLATIVLINLITGAILYFTLAALQTREQTQRIEKDSVLFARFSTAQVISDFSNYYYFYYVDKFLPGIKSVISANENLVGIRIISRRDGVILFDSEGAEASSSRARLTELPQAVLGSEIEAELKNRDIAVRRVQLRGAPAVSVINTYRNENQEAPYYVEYLFRFHSLGTTIQAIKHQLLIDLVPALLISLAIAAVFAQLLISPIRRLVAATKRVAGGDYDVQVSSASNSEVGELVHSFNAMAVELQKKRELRKYLSDSTYRQIMEAPDGHARAGTHRLFATVLFCDIRNFVAHCESLEAEEVTAMLNEYFSEMVEVVHANGGEIDKFIGDAFLAVFYDGETPTGTTALQAVYCALEMRERLSVFNARRAARGKNTLDIGVGINWGEIISGPVGANDRMDFTVIGDTVNLASRIETISKQGRSTKIVFSNHVEERVRGLLEYEILAEEPIRGKQEAIKVFELTRIRDLDQMIAHVRGNDREMRRRSIELLGVSRNPSAVPIVIPCLSDTEEAIRSAAIGALGKLVQPEQSGQDGAIKALFERLHQEASPKVLSALIATLGRVCRDERILVLEPFLEANDERIVANAVEALGLSRLPRCMDVVLPKLASRNNRVKANAAMALFGGGRVEVIETLKPMLLHSDPLMRSSAAFAIGELTLLAEREKLLENWKNRKHGVKAFLAELQECVPMLVSLLGDPESMVKRQAMIALGKIKDRSAVLPIIDAIDFEKDSKELIRDAAEALRLIGSHKLVREVLSRLE